MGYVLIGIYIPVTPDLFACNEMRMFEGWTWYFSASLATTGLASRGESFDPKGEYAVTMMPFDLQNSIMSS